MKNIAIACLLLLSATLTAQDFNIEEQLYNLPDVIFKKINTPLGYEAAYELRIKQQIDHQDPKKGYFYQRAYLSHRGFNRPTTMVTQGYTSNSNRISEVAELIKSNQIDVEHRFFGESVPDSIEYQYLTLEQATADLHHINEIFRKIYPNKWVSTGISKGGQTSIFYRYFYPEDVDVSIPYVAPLNASLEDERIYTFLDTVGTNECRAKIKALQTRLLKERESVLPLLRWYSYGAQLHFNYLTFEEAFEYAVLEYSFSFWQWGNDCNDIPSKNASLEEVLYHFVTVSGVDFFADQSMEDFASHYYQAGSQMGYYGYNISDFKPLLKALPTDKNPSAVFMPNKMKVPFNNSTPKKAAEWAKKHGNKMIYINGNSDTWSATAIRPNDNVDAIWFFLDGKDHRDARIKNMNNSERVKLVNNLERWLDMEIE
ncbi:S28 family serine protease [Acidiluteibacter ferrifornacis]|uniref:Aminopeptidase n=1 Tax=Acidiluteibacter ferrifornacis TaxID=2692424 RepID=A0A6N9NJ75_9FLAO|nr:S28 family serine protease [Acidiluteibacter ferrifornacis]NBG65912.1 hypothetical protein [Acidiluteibacter ferrifornacis]